MSFPAYHGRAAGSADVIAQVEALLARVWDPSGDLVRTATSANPLYGGIARPEDLA